MRQLQECGDPSCKRLQGVRHIYATPARDEGHNIKTLSERIGHADVTVTGKIYIHKSRGTDRSMADAMGALIERLAAGGTADRAGKARGEPDPRRPPGCIPARVGAQPLAAARMRRVTTPGWLIIAT